MRDIQKTAAGDSNGRPVVGNFHSYTQAIHTFLDRTFFALGYTENMKIIREKFISRRAGTWNLCIILFIV